MEAAIVGEEMPEQPTCKLNAITKNRTVLTRSKSTGMESDTSTPLSREDAPKNPPETSVSRPSQAESSTKTVSIRARLKKKETLAITM